MSTLALLGATAAAAFLIGRATLTPTRRRLRRQLSTAVHHAHHDPLTGLPNRAGATVLFDARAARSQATTVALVDLDDFKTVNDTHGHHVGDQLLTAVADRLSRTAADHGGTAARLAGDEFLLLLPIADGDATHPVAAALIALTTPVTVTTADGATTTLTPRATAGVNHFDGLNGTLPTVLRHADIALYHGKRQRSGITTYRPGMHMPPPRPRRRLRDHRRATRRQVQR